MDYYAYQSQLRDWNAGLKAITSIGVLLLCILSDRPAVSAAVILTTAAVTVRLGKMPVGSYAGLMRIPLTFLILGSAAIAAGFSREPYGDYMVRLGGIYLYTTQNGIRLALRLTLKSLGAVSAMYMLVLSTPAGELIALMRNCRVPKLAVELMNLIYRFIFLLLDTEHRMRDAAASRLGYRDFRTSCRSFGHTAANLLVVSLKKSDTYYNALVSRCYDGELLFLEEEKRVKPWQAMAAAGYLAALLLVYAAVRAV